MYFIRELKPDYVPMNMLISKSLHCLAGFDLRPNDYIIGTFDFNALSSKNKNSYVNFK